MNIQIVTGATALEATENLLKTISPDEESFIVVPDRTTLQIEEMLFDALNLKATFNLSVIGLTNLATKYVSHVSPLSEIDSVLFVKKAIENKKSELKYFKSTNINFCKEIYKLISQFKSSSISPAEVTSQNVAQTSLAKKINDVKIVYEEFESLTCEFDDPSELVDKFVDEIESKHLFDNVKFYFTGFDSFTSKHYSLLRSLCKNAKSVCISLPSPLAKQNAYIYETDIMDKVRKIATSLDCPVQVISQSNLHAQAKEICCQLYSSQKRPVESTNVRIFEGRNKSDEANFVAKVISYLVYKGARYRDFGVAVANIEQYESELKLAFEKNDVPYYFDSGVNAAKCYLAILFKKILTLSYKNFKKEDILFLLSSPLADGTQEDVDFASQSLLSGAKIFFSLKSLSQIKEIVKQLSLSLQNGVEMLIDFVEQASEKIDSLGLDEKVLSTEKQVPQILREILSSCSRTTDFSSMSEVISSFDIGLETHEISAIPSYYDQVYVGDATDSYFGKVKNLFLIGANAGALPKVAEDNSIFSDEELEQAKFAKKVEPSIKMINRRSRFKLFSLLCSWSQNLFVSYCVVGDDSKPLAKSAVVNEIAQIFSLDGKIIRSILPDLLKDEEKLLVSVGKSKHGAEDVISQTSNPQIRGFLSEMLAIDLEKFDRTKPISNLGELGYGSTIKPTEIEKFYDCPFKLVCENVLKLKEKLPHTLAPVDVGSLVHKVLQIYGEKFECKMLAQDELSEFVDKVLSEQCDFSALDDGELERAKLKKDIMKICNVVARERDLSQFKPWLFEKPIEADVAGKHFYGRVDRVDKSSNIFRVIDYKTGEVSSNLAKDLSLGKKLQLFVYSKYIEKQTSLKCGGVYYFSVKPGHSTKPQKSLVGVTTENAKNLIQQKDYTSSQDFEQMQNQAEKLMIKASNYIQQGKLFPYPDDKSCKFCRYKSICLYDKENGVRLQKGENNDTI